MGVIVLTARRLGLGSVALVLPHRGLVRIFRVCRLDRLLDIYETQEQAVRGLPTSQLCARFLARVPLSQGPVGPAASAPRGGGPPLCASRPRGTADSTRLWPLRTADT